MEMNYYATRCNVKEGNSKERIVASFASENDAIEFEKVCIKTNPVKIYSKDELIGRYKNA